MLFVITQTKFVDDGGADAVAGYMFTLVNATAAVAAAAC